MCAYHGARNVDFLEFRVPTTWIIPNAKQNCKDKGVVKPPENIYIFATAVNGFQLLAITAKLSMFVGVPAMPLKCLSPLLICFLSFIFFSIYLFFLFATWTFAIF